MISTVHPSTGVKHLVRFHDDGSKGLNPWKVTRTVTECGLDYQNPGYHVWTGPVRQCQHRGCK